MIHSVRRFRKRTLRSAFRRSAINRRNRFDPDQHKLPWLRSPVPFHDNRLAFMSHVKAQIDVA